MSTSPVVNVLRYTALGLGVFYGFSHQRSITATQAAEKVKREYQHKQDLINKAKAEYAKMKNPQSAGGNGVVQDPMDPKFDLEAYFKDMVAQNP